MILYVYLRGLFEKFLYICNVQILYNLITEPKWKIRFVWYVI